MCVNLQNDNNHCSTCGMKVSLQLSKDGADVSAVRATTASRAAASTTPEAPSPTRIIAGDITDYSEARLEQDEVYLPCMLYTSEVGCRGVLHKSSSAP